MSYLTLDVRNRHARRRGEVCPRFQRSITRTRASGETLGPRFPSAAVHVLLALPVAKFQPTVLNVTSSVLVLVILWLASVNLGNIAGHWAVAPLRTEYEQPRRVAKKLCFRPILHGLLVFPKSRSTWLFTPRPVSS